jgi:hypothetical protein
MKGIKKKWMKKYLLNILKQLVNVIILAQYVFKEQEIAIWI